MKRQEEGIIQSIFGIIFAILLFSALGGVIIDSTLNNELGKILMVLMGLAIFGMVVVVIIKIIEKIQEIF